MVHNAELVDIRMEADLALSHRKRRQNRSWFFINSQLSRALTQQLRTAPDLFLQRQDVDSFIELTGLSLTARATLVWCPAHVGFQEDKEANQETKSATVAGTPSNLPMRLAAVKEQITP